MYSSPTLARDSRSILAATATALDDDDEDNDCATTAAVVVVDVAGGGGDFTGLSVIISTKCRGRESRGGVDGLG